MVLSKEEDKRIISWNDLFTTHNISHNQLTLYYATQWEEDGLQTYSIYSIACVWPIYKPHHFTKINHRALMHKALHAIH